MSWVDGSVRALDAIGVNVHGIASLSDHPVFPDARSVVVFGSGGTALFDALCRAIRRDARVLADEDHPLDAFVKRAVDGLALPAGCHVVRAAADETTFVDFRPLAHAAGLGHPSRLGLLLHPKHGPWLGLRVAIFTDEVLEPTGPVRGPNPCASCTACVPACPFGAIASAEDPRRSFDIKTCAAAHQDSDVCARTCHARAACPQGDASRYSALQVYYHYNRSTGRRALAEALQVHDPRTGVGPFWSEWSEDG